MHTCTHSLAREEKEKENAFPNKKHNIFIDIFYSICIFVAKISPVDVV